MRGGRFRRILERMCRGDDVDLAIRSQFFNDSVDQARINQWLVALDINYVPELFPLFCDFGNAIGSALMPWGGQRNFRAPVKSRICNAQIVGGDDNGIQFFSASTTFPDVTEKWLTSNKIQWFTRKTRGSPTGRDYSGRLTHLQDRRLSSRLRLDHARPCRRRCQSCRYRIQFEHELCVRRRCDRTLRRSLCRQ